MLWCWDSVPLCCLEPSYYKAYHNNNHEVSGAYFDCMWVYLAHKAGLDFSGFSGTLIARGTADMAATAILIAPSGSAFLPVQEISP